MIDKNKQYRTRDGREVRIYATDGHPHEPVHGAIKDHSGKWNHSAWFGTGVNLYRLPDADLIEVKPRIKREYWVNIGEGGAIQSWHQEKDVLEDFCVPTTRACVKFVIDCEEREGL